MKPIFRILCRVASVMLGVFLLGAFVLAGMFLYFNAAPTIEPKNTDSIQIKYARVSDSEPIAFIEVRDGESAISVGRRLKEAGLIKNVFLWNVLSHLDKKYVKVGAYNLDFPQTQMAIRKILQEGKQILLRVTVPEGVTLKKAAAIFQDAEICKADAFLDAASDPEILKKYHVPGINMEGYLYPDTYLFTAGYPPALIIATMADNFFKRLAESGINTAALSPEELYQKVTLASIIEREYRAPDEAAIMGGVFQNRLDIGMKLESCATVEYIITEIQGKAHPERLFNRDIAIQDPYNTYLVSGLPPGPISCPGAVALKAAFFPADSNYLFFRVIDPQAGRHYFSKTFDDHIKAGELYVKGRT